MVKIENVYHVVFNEETKALVEAESTVFKVDFKQRKLIHKITLLDAEPLTAKDEFYWSLMVNETEQKAG